jgi:hypothetical protein
LENVRYQDVVPYHPANTSTFDFHRSYDSDNQPEHKNHNFLAESLHWPSAQIHRFRQDAGEFFMSCLGIPLTADNKDSVLEWLDDAAYTHQSPWWFIPELANSKVAMRLRMEPILYEIGFQFKGLYFGMFLVIDESIYNLNSKSVVDVVYFQSRYCLPETQTPKFETIQILQLQNGFLGQGYALRSSSSTFTSASVVGVTTEEEMSWILHQ